LNRYDPDCNDNPFPRAPYSGVRRRVTMPAFSFRPTLPRPSTRVAIAAFASLLLHVLFVSGAMRGLADVFRWSANADPPPARVTARLVEAPPPPAPPIPAPAPAPKPKRPKTEPVRTPASTPSLAVPVAEPATPAPAPAPAPAASDPAPVKPADPPPVAEPPPPPPPPAPVPRPPRASPLPPRAIISLELTLESNNYKVWATQRWEQEGGRYRVHLSAEARALFFTLGSIVLESSGAITPEGLRPERYSDERNRRRTTVEFATNEKSAQVDEASGNRKTVLLAGQAADIMSLTYDLAFNPDINIGAPFTLANRENFDEIRLVARREEMLATEAGNLATRFYDFRRPDGSGGIQVWLATERQWLPAKIRILGRDGALSMVATRYELSP
jgi:hypothetical protein